MAYNIELLLFFCRAVRKTYYPITAHRGDLHSQLIRKTDQLSILSENLDYKNSCQSLGVQKDAPVIIREHIDREIA